MDNKVPALTNCLSDGNPAQIPITNRSNHIVEQHSRKLDSFAADAVAMQQLHLQPQISAKAQDYPKELPSESEPPFFTCPESLVSPGSFQVPAEMIEWNKNRHDTRKVLCDFCSQSFKREGDRDRHVKSRHLGLRFLCPNANCYKTYTRKDQLAAHVAKKHPDSSMKSSRGGMETDITPQAPKLGEAATKSNYSQGRELGSSNDACEREPETFDKTISRRLFHRSELREDTPENPPLRQIKTREPDTKVPETKGSDTSQSTDRNGYVGDMETDSSFSDDLEAESEWGSSATSGYCEENFPESSFADLVYDWLYYRRFAAPFTSENPDSRGRRNDEGKATDVTNIHGTKSSGKRSLGMTTWNNSRDDDDEEHPNKRNRKTEPKDRKADHKLACPFLKYDPRKYEIAHTRYKSCSSSFPNLDRLKYHIYKIHRIIECFRCRELFRTPEEKLNHLRQEMACKINNGRFNEGLTDDKELSLRIQAKNSRNQPIGRSWAAIWDLLFPGRPAPSPYRMPVPLTNFPCTKTIEEFVDHMYKELPQQVQAAASASGLPPEIMQPGVIELIQEQCGELARSFLAEHSRDLSSDSRDIDLVTPESATENPSSASSARNADITPAESRDIMAIDNNSNPEPRLGNIPSSNKGKSREVDCVEASSSSLAIVEPPAKTLSTSEKGHDTMNPLTTSVSEGIFYWSNQGLRYEGFWQDNPILSGETSTNALTPVFDEGFWQGNSIVSGEGPTNALAPIVDDDELAEGMDGSSNRNFVSKQ